MVPSVTAARRDIPVAIMGLEDQIPAIMVTAEGMQVILSGMLLAVPTIPAQKALPHPEAHHRRLPPAVLLQAAAVAAATPAQEDSKSLL